MGYVQTKHQNPQPREYVLLNYRQSCRTVFTDTAVQICWYKNAVHTQWVINFVKMHVSIQRLVTTS